MDFESDGGKKMNYENIKMGRIQTYSRLKKEDTDEGTVVYGVYNSYIRCAVKIVNILKLASNVNRDLPATIRNLSRAFLNEVSILSRLNHPNLVKIIDYGTVDPLSGTEDPLSIGIVYVAMEYVTGKNILEAIRPKGENFFLETGVIIEILEQLFEGVSYLHSCGISHLDLKPDNILVDTRNDSVRVSIIDMGSAVIFDKIRFMNKDKEISNVEEYSHEDSAINEMFTKINEKDTLYVKFDPVYSPDSLKKYSKGVLLERKEIASASLFPSKDLFSLGKIISEIANILSGKETGKLAFQRLRYRKEFIDGLRIISEQLNRSLESTSSLDRALKLLKKLDPGYLSTVEIPELSTEGAQKTDIMLNEGMVSFSERISHIIDHPFFHRLNFVPQLEFEYLVYPDARHSRASHCMLTFHYARLSLLTLMEDFTFRFEVDKEDIQAVLLYALLHDIGHYPLSHMFEDIKTPEGISVPSDDDLFMPLLGFKGISEFSSLDILEAEPSILKIIEGDFGSSIIEKIKQLAYVCNSRLKEEKDEPPPIYRFLGGLISSAIDVDKVAYLTHDSIMSGARLGSSVNVHYYPSSLKFPGIDRLQDFISQIKGLKKGHASSAFSYPSTVLCIRDSGISTAESIILARYWMVSRVYWHRTNRAIQAVFKFVIGRLMQNSSGNEFFKEYLAKNFYYSETQAMQWLSDSFDNKFGNNSSYYNPLAPLSNFRRRETVYVRLIAFRFNSNKEKGIYERLTKTITNSDIELTLTDKVTETVSRIIGKLLENKKEMLNNIPDKLFYENENKIHSIKKGALVFDIPRKTRDTIFPENIMVVRDERPGYKYESLDKASLILGREGKSFSREFVNETKKIRVFIHHDLLVFLRNMGALSGEQKKEFDSRIIETIEDFLKNHNVKSEK
jgi:HD superfamily phosphohydrolase